MRRLDALVLATALVACSGPSTDEDPLDAGGGVPPPTDASLVDTGANGPPPIEIGTGDRGFVPVTAGSVVPITLGTQGTGRFDSYHLEGAFRVRGLGARNVTVDYRILLLPERRSIARFQRRYPMLQPIDGDGFGAWGMIAQLEDCCLARDAELVMSVEVTGADGQVAKDELQIRGGPLCSDVNGAEICP